MGIIAEPHRSKLYTRVKHLLGAPIRSVELEDEMLDSLLELAIGDYSQYIQDWLIESQWSALQNLNLDEQSLARAFVTRSLDYALGLLGLWVDLDLEVLADTLN